jgi:hypothetical protein
VLPVPYGDGFEAENSNKFLGQSILFHNLRYDFDNFFLYVLEIGK